MSQSLSLVQIITDKITIGDYNKLVEDDIELITLYDDNDKSYTIYSSANNAYLSISFLENFGDNSSAIVIRGNFQEELRAQLEEPTTKLTKIKVWNINKIIGYSEEIGLNEFDLQNIDDMRYELLGAHTLVFHIQSVTDAIGTTKQVQTERVYHIRQIS